ncbi:hypothetical protein V8G54_029531 [Vigna mungo]|uniref:Uncharacterized protein n=1 Tax=Vigna mungo TaxID=3915 RepID=A0AAQ3MUT7_VIGMU
MEGSHICCAPCKFSFLGFGLGFCAIAIAFSLGGTTGSGSSIVLGHKPPFTSASALPDPSSFETSGSTPIWIEGSHICSPLGQLLFMQVGLGICAVASTFSVREIIGIGVSNKGHKTPFSSTSPSRDPTSLATSCSKPIWIEGSHI